MKAYLRHTEPCKKKPEGLCVTSLFLDNNRQHRLVCAKTISSWVREVLSVLKNICVQVLSREVQPMQP